MANTFAPFGFQPFGRREGGSPTAGLTRCVISASDTHAIFRGDTVVASSLPATRTGNAQYITADTSGYGAIPPVKGVFMGCEYYNANVGRVVWSPWFPGSVGTTSGAVGSEPIAYIIDDPQQLFLCQGTSNAYLGSSNIGMDFVANVSTAGSQVTGLSVAALSSIWGSSAAGIAYPFRLVDLYYNYAPPGAAGADYTSTSQWLVVAPNNWARQATYEVSS